MIVQSSFKDYYDFCANQYGGGDPKIVYERRRLGKPTPGYSGELHWYPFEADAPKPLRRTPDFMQFRLRAKWLAVMGRYYLLLDSMDKPGNYRILSSQEFGGLYRTLGSNKSRHRHLFLDEVRDLNWYLGSAPDDALLAFTKKLNTPVFVFEGSARGGFNSHLMVRVDSEIPVLGNIGFASIYKPEQLYQDLSYFMGNVIRDSPDTALPHVLTDKERIVQHGFDLKQSFRHRKG